MFYQTDFIIFSHIAKVYSILFWSGFVKAASVMLS